MDDYGTRLKAVCDRLASAGIVATIRSEGAGRFVFAELGTRAAELSKTDDGHVWVEFWDDPDALPVREETFDSFEVGVEAARKWLHPA